MMDVKMKIKRSVMIVMEELTESDDDGDDFVHPKLTTHDDDIIHEEETDEDDSFDPTIHTPSRAKSDEEATYEEDQGNEADEDTNTDLDGRNDVMTDVILPQVQATQEIEDTHVTLTLVNPDGQQYSSSVSSGFVSKCWNPNSRHRCLIVIFWKTYLKPPLLN
ncbi:hypothetical protein Tco_0384929 [Tanacetum coccineum]